MSVLSTSSAESCWICLQEDGNIVRACKCPRGVHLDCLALWSLHQAGGPEEKACRFCSSSLPDWKETLAGGKRTDPLNQVPVVAVLFDGCEWRLRVAPTPEGRLRFRRQLELLTGIPFHEQTHVKFHCKTPRGPDVSLSGTRCLEAAIHCAAIHCAHHQQGQGEHSQHPQMPQEQQQIEQQAVTPDLQQQKVLQLLADALPSWPQQVQQQHQQHQQQQLMSPRAVSLLQQDARQPQQAEMQPQVTTQPEATMSLRAAASSRSGTRRVTAALRQFKKLGQLSLLKHLHAC